MSNDSQSLVSELVAAASLETCQKCKFLEFMSDPPNQNLEAEPSNLVWTNPLGNVDAC